MISFKDWFAARESSAFTRSRMMAALGLGPDIPLAAINSRSTAPPWMTEKLTKKKKKKKKSKKIEEGKAQTPNYSFDDIISKIIDVKKLSDELNKKKQSEKDKKKTQPEEKPDKSDNKDKRQKPKNISNNSLEKEDEKEAPVEKVKTIFNKLKSRQYEKDEIDKKKKP